MRVRVSVQKLKVHKVPKNKISERNRSFFEHPDVGWY